MSQPPSARPPLLRWAGWFALANGVLATLIALRYLPYVPLERLDVQGFAALAVPAQMIGLASLLVVAIWPLAASVPYRPVVFSVAVLIATGLQLLLLVDTQVFAQYRFHLNGFILDLVLKAGSQVFAFGWTMFLWAGIIAVVVAGVEIALAAMCWIWARRPLRRLGWAAVGLLLVMQLGTHGWHAWAVAHDDTDVASLAYALPFANGYFLTANRALEERGWVDLAAYRKSHPGLAAARDEAGALNYPRSPLRCDPPAAEERLNVLFLVVDSLRADTLNETATPNATRFARGPHVYRFGEHLSAANRTQTGIFSIFYGMPGMYFASFLDAERPPVLLEELQRAGYAIQALGSATLTSPPFHRTVFASVDNLRTNTPGETDWERDAQITEDFLSFLDSRDDTTPFFGFLFWNSLHSTSVPPDFPRPFQPFWEEVNHFELRPDFDPIPYFNRYKTSALYVDGLIGKLLDALAAKRLLENTIIVITSDHGEEFNDTGGNFWGHGSNFSDVQLRVPMLLYWPGRPGGDVLHTTSHMDIVPTLMQSLLRCRAPVEDYAAGASLLSGRPHDYVLISNYRDYGIRTRNGIVTVDANGRYSAVRTDGSGEGDIELDGETLKAVLSDMSRFYE